MKNQLLLLLASATPALALAAPAVTTPEKMAETTTHGAAGKRADARELRRQSDERLAAKDYQGAMSLRWQMLAIGGQDASQMGTLAGSAIQSLALDDISTIAVHLDARACRRFAEQLATSEALRPSYADILRREEASRLLEFARVSPDATTWQKTFTGLFDRPDQQNDLRTMQSTTRAQIRANIKQVYAQAIRAAARPYGEPQVQLPVDPYTSVFAAPSRSARFLWTRDKTQRLLVLAALRARADRLEGRAAPTSLPDDPFGIGPFKKKNGVIYSVGPDGRDDGGKFAPSVASKRSDYKGDIPAPSF